MADDVRVIPVDPAQIASLFDLTWRSGDVTPNPILQWTPASGRGGM